MAITHQFFTLESDHGRRLDQTLAAHIESLSRTKARVVLGLGGVFVDGHRTKVAGRLMRTGLRIEVHMGAALQEFSSQGEFEEAELAPFLHDDDDLLVVEKPSGLFSAPTQESDQNNLLSQLERQLHQKLHLVHRLDRPTSGLMVFAKNAGSAAALGAQFQAHSITRRYWALLIGQVQLGTFEVTRELEQRPARTVFHTLAVKSHVSSVRAELFTGRTHQVRLHAEAVGHAVAGDSKYGRREARTLTDRPPRLALHAEHLAFDHPQGGRLTFESPGPSELVAYWERLA